MNINATLLGQTISFILFVWFCKAYVWPPLIAAIEKRQKDISDGLEAAKRSQKDLELVQAKVKEQLKDAKKEANAIVENAVKRQNEIIAQASVLAQHERDKLLNKAHAEIESERHVRKKCVNVLHSRLSKVRANYSRKNRCFIHTAQLDKLASEL